MVMSICLSVRLFVCLSSETCAAAAGARDAGRSIAGPYTSRLSQRFPTLWTSSLPVTVKFVLAAGAYSQSHTCYLRSARWNLDLKEIEWLDKLTVKPHGPTFIFLDSMPHCDRQTVMPTASTRYAARKTVSRPWPTHVAPTRVQRY